MQTTITLSDIPTGVEDHTATSNANTGTEFQLEKIGVKNAVAQNIIPDITQETQAINHSQLVTDYISFIQNRKTSLERFNWMVENGILQGEPRGEFGAFPLEGGDLPETFHSFVEAFFKLRGMPYNRNVNMVKRLSSTEIGKGLIQEPTDMRHAKIDAYTLHYLFGKENMDKSYARCLELHKYWWSSLQNIEDSEQRENAGIQYLKRIIDLDVKKDEVTGGWILTGTRSRDGRFLGWNALYASGALVANRNQVHGLTVAKHDAILGSMNASDASIFFLK